MYIRICPSIIYILKSRRVGRAKLVLYMNMIFILVHGASVEPPMDWKRHGILYGLVQPAQGHVDVSKIWLIFFSFVGTYQIS